MQNTLSQARFIICVWTWKEQHELRSHKQRRNHPRSAFFLRGGCMFSQCFVELYANSCEIRKLGHERVTLCDTREPALMLPHILPMVTADLITVTTGGIPHFRAQDSKKSGLRLWSTPEPPPWDELILFSLSRSIDFIFPHGDSAMPLTFLVLTNRRLSQSNSSWIARTDTFTKNKQMTKDILEFHLCNCSPSRLKIFLVILRWRTQLQGNRKPCLGSKSIIPPTPSKKKKRI